MTSRRERRSVSLGRHRDHRDRIPRDSSRPPEEDVSTRHNISNFVLTLQRVQAAEEENRTLRKENQILRQRNNRSSRLSSASFNSGPSSHNSSLEQTTILPEAEDEIIAENVKRNSLLFVGDSVPVSAEHAALEAQYKKLQDDFSTVKEFLKHLFQHALTMSSGGADSQTASNWKDKDPADVNTYSGPDSKQLERNLEDIHGQIAQLKNSQDKQGVKMEQVQRALDHVLSQSSVRNDFTMRIVRQQDKMKEISQHVAFLEQHLHNSMVVSRQSEDRSRQTAKLGQDLEELVASHSKLLKGNTKEQLSKIADQLSQIGRRKPTCHCKMAAINKMVGHMITAANRGESLIDSRPPADVINTITKLERLVGSDWHRLGRVLGLPTDVLDDIGKFTNFDLTSRVEKVVTSWIKHTRGTSAEILRQALDKMDKDALLLADFPICKEFVSIPQEVVSYTVAHIVDVPTLINSLTQQGMLSQDARAFILGTSHEQRRSSRLINSTIFMGPPALQALCSALETSNQRTIASKIRGCLPQHNLNNNNNNQSLCRDATLRNTTDNQFITSTPNTKLLKQVSNEAALKTNTVSPPPKLNTQTTTSRSGEKQEKPEKHRKKRSRSLFTRKNKLRDSEMDYDFEVTGYGDGSYFYPATNTTFCQARFEEREKTLTLTDTHSKRQFGRRGHAPSIMNNSEGIVV